jgi:hypothetical protein
MSHEADDNPRILDIIKERMKVGVERYGHGLRSEDDTRQWGNKDDSWVEMAIEEALDLCVYLATALIRIENERKALDDKIRELEARQKQVLMTEKVDKQKKQSLWNRFMWGRLGEE